MPGCDLHMSVRLIRVNISAGNYVVNRTNPQRQGAMPEWKTAARSWTGAAARIPHLLGGLQDCGCCSFRT